MTHSRIYLGIDGGGTNCRARLVDGDGRVLGEGRAGPANLRLGVDVVWAAMQAAALEAMSAAGLVADRATIVAAAGLAGTSRRETFAALVAHKHDYASLTLVEDTVIACLGAHGGRDGGIVIAGTGSVGFGIFGEKQVRVGGYGFPISDEGSGADLGLEALRRVARSLDGRSAATPLIAELLASVGGSTESLVAWMDRASATDYASLAECVVRHAAGGDAVACELMTEAAVRIEGLVVALVAGGVPRVALMGGLAPALTPLMSAAIRARLSPAEGDALDGALVLARRSSLQD